MRPIVVSDILAVGEMPSLDQIEILAKAGFKSIINNQLDGEVERFPTSAKVAEAAQRYGLAYAYAPVVSRTPSAEELAAFERALAELPAPIFAFCYSGARSAAACAFAMTAEKDAPAIVAEFARAGFDVAALLPWLEEERAHRKQAMASSGRNGALAVNGSARNGGHVNGEHSNGKAHVTPSPMPPTTDVAQPLAKQALQGIVVHARARGMTGFAG